MGNQCGKNICPQEHDIIDVVPPTNYNILEKSKLIEDPFPEDLIPETVREKIKLLNLQINLNRSEIWKYEDTETKDPSYVVYTIVGKQSLFQKQVPQNSEQKIILNKSVPSTQANHLQKNRKFDPTTFQNATIFIFKSPKTDISNNSINSKQNSYAPNFTLQKVYYGPVSKLMHASQATVILQNGQYYQGNVHDLDFEGNGRMTNALGNHQYEGGWKDNQPHGYGTEILVGQFEYEGDFSKGKWNGNGTLTLLNSRNRYSIKADFIQGNIEGSGKVFSQQNINQQSNKQPVYEGSFKDGKQNGFGKWHSSNGQSYQGDFVNGQKEGQGVYTFRSGDCYQGTFKAGNPQGEGELVQGDRRTKGYWYKGENVLVYKQERK